MATLRSKDELEFLPAALEIQETPPSPMGRAIIWTIITLFALAVIWACVGKIDIVAVAQGKVVPGGRTKIIQPLEIGTISAIHVADGQTVKKGDVLIELDTTGTGADAKRVGNEYSAAQAELARAGALVKALQHHAPPAARWPRAVAADIIDTQRQLLDGQWQQYQARLASLDNEHDRRQAELLATEEQIKKLEGTLPLITERAQSLAALSDEKLVSRHSYLEIEQQRIEQGQDLATQRQTWEQLRSNIKQLQEQRRAEAADALNKALADLASVSNRSQGLSQENVKADQRTQLQHLTAPVDGVVQQLAVHTVGGVVTPAQQLMVIVPLEESMEVEAIIQNRDIGFVAQGQRAEVKVDAFPYTKYGTLDAELSHVSTDAVPDDKLGLIFTARVLLKQSVMKIDEKLIRLSPGMAVTVEVKTGSRRLIEYVLSPLAQYASESVRER